jgi:hypothetical protein
MNSTTTAVKRHSYTASILGGSDEYRPTTDLAFDIETGPLPNCNQNLLCPRSSRLAAIGYYQPDRDLVCIAHDTDEAAMLRQFWSIYDSIHSAGAKCMGFNILAFDIPYLMQRSWHLEVQVPSTVMAGSQFSKTFIDLMRIWQCGQWKSFISLDNLARFLGVGGKTQSGEMFWKLWESDREAAIKYLHNDVKLVIDCARRMQFSVRP